MTLTDGLERFRGVQTAFAREYRIAKYVFLANIAPDLQHDVLKQVKGNMLKLIAMDTMNYWIERTNAEIPRDPQASWTS